MLMGKSFLHGYQVGTVKAEETFDKPTANIATSDISMYDTSLSLSVTTWNKMKVGAAT